PPHCQRRLPQFVVGFWLPEQHHEFRYSSGTPRRRWAAGKSGNFQPLQVRSITSFCYSTGFFPTLRAEIFPSRNCQTCGHSELPIQYADFAVWQRQYLQGDRLAEQLDYWREQLRDLTTLDLPADHPRPPTQTFSGATHEIHLPLSMIEDLTLLGREDGATLFMTLLAAFQTLLHPL